MKKCVQFLAALVLALLVFTALPAAVSADDSGVTGQCQWKYNSTTKTLTISGQGAAESYSEQVSPPWAKYRSGITRVVVEDGVTRVGSYSFYYYRTVTSISLADSVRSIGENAFTGNLVEELQLPASLETIGECAFFELENLAGGIEIPAGVKTIGSSAFASCFRLHHVLFAGNGALKTIGERAFADTALEYVVLPKGLTSIGEYAFGYMTIPREFYSQNFIGVYGFDDTAKNYAEANGLFYTACEGDLGGCSYLYDDATNTLTVSGDGVIPDFEPNMINGRSQTTAPWDGLRFITKYLNIEYDINQIGSYAFWDFDKVSYFFTPNTVTRIGTYAFAECDGADTINILGKDCVIEDGAFRECGGNRMSLIDLSGVSVIEDEAFLGCNSSRVELRSGLKKIGEAAFSGNGTVGEVEIPADCEYVGSGAFMNCGKLQKITFYSYDCEIIDEAYTTSDTAVIYGFKNSTAEAYAKNNQRSFVDIGSGTVGECTFSFDPVTGCLTISGNGTTETGEVFSPWYDYNHLIRSAVIRNGVKDIGSNLFSGSKHLSEVTVVDSVGRIGGSAFSNCDSLVSITLPGSVREIENGAFSVCGALEEVRLSTGLEKVGQQAFAFCDSLKEITFPKTVVLLEKQALNSCENLKKVVFQNRMTEIGEYAIGYAQGQYGQVRIGSPVLYSSCGTEKSTVETYAGANGLAYEITGHKLRDTLTPATPTADGQAGLICSICGGGGFARVIPMASKVSLSKKTFVYNGKVQVPTLYVRDRNGENISKDYYTATISPAPSKKIGKYTVRVTFEGNYTGTVTLSYSIVMRAPGGLHSDRATVSGIRLVWDKVTGAKYYWLQMSADGKTWKNVAKYLETNQAAVKGLTAGTTYYFRVRAVNSAKTIAGSYSEPVRTGTLTKAPTLTAKSLKSKSITLKWSAVKGAVKYAVYTSADGKTWTRKGITKNLKGTLSKQPGGKLVFVKVVGVNEDNRPGKESAVNAVTVKP